jgi:chromosome segregation ATPase
MKEIQISICRFFKLFVYSKFIGFVLFAFLFSAMAYGQATKPNKTDMEIKKLETQLKTAKANLAKAEKAAAISDSLSETGKAMEEEADNEYNEATAEQKRLEKEYNTQVKGLSKKMNSKDKEVATEAKAEFKTIDTKYKADIKEIAAKIKSAEKKTMTGKLNADKGKATKKTTAASLKTAQASVDAIEQKIEAVKSGDDGVKPKGKKKK